MPFQIDRYLQSLAQPDPDARRLALEAALEAEGLKAEVQEAEDTQTLRPARNYLLPARSSDLCPLFIAHYDAYPGSTGANDNAAALCILLELAAELRRRGIDAAFAFLDGEETGHTGAKMLEAERQREYSVVVNLDLCGYGDTIAVYARGSEKKPGARPFCRKELLTAHRAQLVKYLPEGDNVCFSTKRQPVLSIAIMPKWDTKFLDAMAAQGSGLLGRTPEFKMMIGQMEVVSTIHGSFRDQVKWIMPESMEQVYKYLLEAMCQPPEQKKKFSLFGR